MNRILCVIIPAFNEEQSISNLIQQIPQVPQFNNKIQVINDGSTDNTAQFARQKGATVVSNPKNLGLGSTLKIGLHNALNLNPDIIVILDGDGQYHPKDISRLVFSIVNENVNLVIGNRFLSNFNSEIKNLKKYANKILSVFICKILFRLDEVYDVQSSFRAFTSDFAKFIYANLEGEYNYAQEMFILAVLNGYNIKQIPVKSYSRSYGKSKLIKNLFVYIFKVLYITLKTYVKIKIRTYLR